VIEEHSPETDPEPAVSRLEIESDIGPEAAAILEFTSNIGEAKPPHALTFITSKDAYIWAGVAAELAKREEFSDAIDTSIKTALYSALASMSLPLEEPKLPRFPVDGAAGPREIQGSYYLLNWCLRSFLDEAEVQADDDFIRNVDKNIDVGYQTCLDLNLISDPVIEMTMGLAILGLVPFSIVKRTKDGEVVYKKIQAGLWKYEREKRRGGIEHTSVSFTAARIARAMKTGLISAWHDATKDEGDEVV
jgi:hypothetical protein